MGNVNHTRRLQDLEYADDYDISAFHGLHRNNHPLAFHNQMHSESINLSHDRRIAKRISSFRGICFTDRPLCISERVCIRIAETSSTHNGVLRVGLMSDNPSALNIADLPTYACPDITYEQGYWAKAVPENMAKYGNTLFFYITPNGEVVYGVNGKEVGVFFGGVQTDLPLWALMDLYGTTTSVELTDVVPTNAYIPSPFDSKQLSVGRVCISEPNHFQPATSAASTPQVLQHPSVTSSTWPNLQNISPAQVQRNTPSSQFSNHPSSSSAGPVYLGGGLAAKTNRQIVEISDPLPFHLSVGRNVFLSQNRTVATRGQHDYCNGYVFTYRPLEPGEKLMISILAVTNEYSGGLAFGMTSCDPGGVNRETLPDDSDLLLDRRDYWVVHKDVCIKPEINDELNFHFMFTGEVRYSKNGRHVGTLMHVDTTLPLWAFIDIYGSTQQIKSLGVVTPVMAPTTMTTSTIAPTPVVLQASDFHNLDRGRAVSVPTIERMISSHLDDMSSISEGISSLRATSAQEDVSVRRLSLADSTAPPSLPPKLSRRNTSAMATAAPAVMASSPAPSGSRGVAPAFQAPAAGSRPATTGMRSAAQLINTAASSFDLVLNVSDVPPALPPPLIPIPISATKRHEETGMKSSPPLKLFDPPTAKPRRRTTTTRYDNSLSSSFSSPTDAKRNEMSEECVVCMERVPDCALYTCGHMCMCYECAVDIVNNQNGLCPICRLPIRDIIKIFRS